MSNMEKAKAEIRVSTIVIPNPKIDSVNAAVPDHNHSPARWRRFKAANGSSLFSMEVLRWEAPNPKLQASILRSRHDAEERCDSAATAEDGPQKFQGPNFNAPSWMATTSLGLGLELESWSFFGAWRLGLGTSLRAVFH
jgi:hypothetical protein